MRGVGNWAAHNISHPVWNYIHKRISSSFLVRVERVALLVWYQQVPHGWRHILGWVLPLRRWSCGCTLLTFTSAHGITGPSQSGGGGHSAPLPEKRTLRSPRYQLSWPLSASHYPLSAPVLHLNSKFPAFLKKMLGYSWFTMLCEFQVYSKVNLLHIYEYLLFFRFSYWVK